jgi:hypothetical protein
MELSMKYLVVGIALLASVSAVSAAELPNPGEGYPNEWIQLADKSCTPKEGVDLHLIVHMRSNANGIPTRVVRIERNGTPVFQVVTVLGTGKDRKVDMTLVHNGELVRIDPETNAAEGQKLTDEALGATIDELAVCD